MNGPTFSTSELGFYTFPNIRSLFAWRVSEKSVKWRILEGIIRERERRSNERRSPSLLNKEMKKDTEV